MINQAAKQYYHRQGEGKVMDERKQSPWLVINKVTSFLIMSLFGICSFFIVRWINTIDSNQIALAKDFCDLKTTSSDKDASLSERIARIETIVPEINDNVKGVKIVQNKMNDKLDMLVQAIVRKQS